MVSDIRTPFSRWLLVALGRFHRLPSPAVIFGVGLSRTGTTTFGDACEILGLTRRGWITGAGPPNSHFLLKDWENGDFGHLAEVASRFDVLEDLPWPLVYRQMAEAFPDAKFVLTRRSSTPVWLKSIAEHTRNEYEMHAKVYGAPSADADPVRYTDFYDAHLVAVRSYFAGTDRLLEVCWEDGDGWDQLCGFLEMPIPDVPFPQSNAGPVAPTPRRPWVVRKARRLRKRVKRMLTSAHGDLDKHAGGPHSKTA